LRGDFVGYSPAEAKIGVCAVEAAELVGPFGPVGSAGPVESVEKGDMWFLLFAGDGNGGFCPGEPR